MANLPGTIYSETIYACDCAGCGLQVRLSAAEGKAHAVFNLRQRLWCRGSDDRWRCPECAEKPGEEASR